MEKKVKLYVKADYNPYDGYDHLVILTEYQKDATLKDWEIALRKIWDDIKYWQEHQKITPKKRKSIRKTTLLKWDVFERDNFTCKHWGKRKDLEMDHIIPVTKGGKDVLSNLQTLCKRCNLLKGNN